MRVLTIPLLLSIVLAPQLPPPPPSVPPPPPQGAPPRDTVRQAAPVGSGVIRGRVVTNDTGSPIRRAMVTLLPMAPPNPVITPPSSAVTTETRTVVIDGVPRPVTSTLGFSVNVALPSKTTTTDLQGAFEFTALPAGSYRLVASAGPYGGAYLGMSFGGTRPSSPGMGNDPGKVIALSDGQRFEEATITLVRGAVITGRVLDEGGEPMVRVQVSSMYFPGGSSRPTRGGGYASTDDLGNFRMFGLPPGDYIVSAEARGPSSVGPNAAPEKEEDRLGFITTFFPSTPDEASAQRVRAKAGAETPGVEIRMATGRFFHISGIVSDSAGRPATQVIGSLMRPSSGGGYNSFGFSTDPQGRFQMRNVAPGNYRLIARNRPQPAAPGQQTPPDPGEVAVASISVASDIDGIVLVTAPGAVITGQIVYEQGPPQAIPGQGVPPARVNAQLADPQNSGPLPVPPPAIATPDMTFTMKGMFGEFLLRASAPGQTLKAVMLGGQDITDTPHEFKNGDRVSIVMTSTASVLTGMVTDARGAPAGRAQIIVFSEDKAAWRYNSIRTRRATSNDNGQFRMTGLLPGRYFAVAVTSERLNIPPSAQDEAFFEQLAKDGTTFVVGESEQRQIDLRVAEGGGER